MDFKQNYNELRAELGAIAHMGFDLQTFIPAVLDPRQFPKRDKRGAVIINQKTAEPEPIFCGKNPSFWNRDGKPVLAKPDQPCTLEEAILRIADAERISQPIGIGIIPRPPFVVIDIDLKTYKTPQELGDDIKRIHRCYPGIQSTRIEVTPGGGRHIFVIVDDLSEWRKSDQGFHCNFSTTLDGPHRGEILTGNRFCACAPSSRFDGQYRVRFPQHAHHLIRIKRLSDLGIYPTVNKLLGPKRSTGLLLPPAVEHKSQHWQDLNGSVDLLRQLITDKAQRVLGGEFAFSADDRSGTLTAFGNELFSWNNLAAEYGYDFSDAVESLFQEAVRALDCEDKGDRVFQTLNPRRCFDDLEWARKRMVKVLEICSVELPALNQLQDLSHHSGSTISGEEMSVEDAINELIRLSSRDRINAKDVLPSYLHEPLSIIGETTEYDWTVILTVLIVGVSGAMPLDSKIELIAGDFCQPLIIWAVLLMPTGELKSPLIKRLILDPWQASVDVLMNQRYQDAVKEWRRQKSDELANGGDSEIPQPRKVRTLITEDRTSQGIERHFMLHERFAKGSVLLLLDEAKDVLLEMSGQSKAGSSLPFGTWILPRYDGAGARGAKADEQNERHYSECRLAALFCCQPEVYRAITGDADQTGLAARFLAVEQTTVCQQFPASFPDSHKQRHETLRKLLSDLYAFVCGHSCIHLELEDDALAAFQKERQYLQDRKNQILNDAERGLLNKCHGRIGRLAGILHLLWDFNPDRPYGRLNTKVGKDAMRRAIYLNRYLLSQTVLVRQTSAGNCTAMQKILMFHNNALKVIKPVRIAELRVTPVSSKRLSKVEAPMVANALHGLGYGRVTKDEKGRLCYQALKPLSA